jgi:hypothetical protein
MAGTAAVPDMRLELVPLPVSDVDRARTFYEQAGFGNLHDTQVSETMRVVQLTPPGSSCAIVFGTGMGPVTDMSQARSKASILSWRIWPRPGRL